MLSCWPKCLQMLCIEAFPVNIIDRHIPSSPFAVRLPRGGSLDSIALTPSQQPCALQSIPQWRQMLLAPRLEHQNWSLNPVNNVELKILAKAAGVEIGRSTQHYWALNIILLMLSSTLVVEFQQAS